jgi:xanthine/uracil permease
MTGISTAHPAGSGLIFLISLLLTLAMAIFSFWFKGFWRSIGMLLGMLLGTCIFALMGKLEWAQFQGAHWLAFPRSWVPGAPGFYWPACIAFALAYLAVLVNSIGSLHGIAKVTDEKRLPRSIRRGLFVNGLSGIGCGLLGIVGTVSFSISPGVVMANRVASRFAITYFGAILIVAAFVPKLSALLSLVPGPVVGAAFCVALAGQIGAGIAIITGKGFESRDYFVVGLPVMLGTTVGILPRAFYTAIPKALQVLLSNGLIVGIVMVLLMEHVLLRKTTEPTP